MYKITSIKKTKIVLYIQIDNVWSVIGRRLSSLLRSSFFLSK